MKKCVLALSVFLLATPAQAEVQTLACKSYETTHEFARLYIKNILVRLMTLVEEQEEAGECFRVTVPDKSHMLKLEDGLEDLAQWVEEVNIVAANFGRPPLEEEFFFVAITRPEGDTMFSLESTRFFND